ncbi:hypothetical protein V2J09_005625 [Rumex salicifolius]
MACCMRDTDRRSKISHWASPGLKEILLKLYRAEKPMDMDHHLYEFGCVEYHIKSSSSDPRNIYVSLSAPILSQATNRVSSVTLETIEGICPGVVEIAVQPKEGYELTLRLSFANIQRPKDSIRIITEVAAVQSVITISHLKQILLNLISDDNQERMPRPLKLAYHPKDPFFIIKQAQKITALLPMRFKEATDVIIATSFFQLIDVGNSEEWAKVPRCSWSPIPPPELRGESIEDLSTNGDILPRHVDEKRMDKTLWNVLNFNAYVRSHVKCTRGFIQRKLRKRLKDLVKALEHTILDDELDEEAPGCGYNMKLKTSSKLKKIKRRCGDLNTKIKRIRYRIKIRGFGHFRRRWFSLAKFSSNKYLRLG